MAENMRVCYDYLFNYFGDDEWNGKVVGGASVNLNIRPYKNEEEVLFEDGDEITTKGMFLSDVFRVHFDRENQFLIERVDSVDVLFRVMFSWEQIKAFPTEYYLYVRDGVELDPVAVTEEEFRAFLSDHVDDFDILDNKNAQVPSVGFYKWQKEGM